MSRRGEGGGVGAEPVSSVAGRMGRVPRGGSCRVESGGALGSCGRVGHGGRGEISAVCEATGRRASPWPWRCWGRVSRFVAPRVAWGRGRCVSEKGHGHAHGRRGRDMNMWGGECFSHMCVWPRMLMRRRKCFWGASAGIKITPLTRGASSRESLWSRQSC